MEDDRASQLIREQLRRLRVAAKMTQEEFGRRVHFSGSMISAIELGQRPPDKDFLARADEVLETGGLLVSLFELAQAGGQPIWFRPWLEAERTARQLRLFEPTLVPGLLQTPNYARAILRGVDTLSEDEVDQRLATRMDRQAILAQESPPQLIAVIDERALHREGEEYAGIMSEQVGHLIACAERPQISVHVIPAEVGLHVGLSGPFALARGADSGWVGHLENQLGGTVVLNDDDLATLIGRWETVRNHALPHRLSIELMKRIASWS